MTFTTHKALKIKIRLDVLVSPKPFLVSGFSEVGHLHGWPTGRQGSWENGTPSTGHGRPTPCTRPRLDVTERGGSRDVASSPLVSGTARQFGRCCSRKQSLLALEVPSATWGPREAAAVHELWCVWQSHLMTCARAPGGSRSGQRRHIPPTHCNGVARDGHARLSAMQVGVVPPLLRKGFPGLPEQRTLLSSTS